MVTYERFEKGTKAHQELKKAWTATEKVIHGSKAKALKKLK